MLTWDEKALGPERCMHNKGIEQMADAVRFWSGFATAHASDVRQNHATLVVKPMAHNEWSSPR